MPEDVITDTILEAHDMRRRFGGLLAVDVEHFTARRAEITALIGPNGAGKTTLFNLLSGFDKPDSGHWSVDGTDLSGKSAAAIARHGVVRTFQLTKALARLTVLDNMRLGATGQRGERFLGAVLPWSWRAQEQEITERADELLGRFKLDRLRNDRAGTLSGGQRKLLEMARAMMVGPKVLMLDEPMAGVNPALTESLLGHVKALRDEGMTIVFVEHDMDVVSEISDRVVCMAEGAVIAEGTPAEIAADDAVIDAYLGTQ